MDLLSLEARRVQHHLDGALAMLRARPATSVRRLVIEELQRYRDRGVFPLNNVRRERTPVFIDPIGTRCAMAHLLEMCGFDSLVARVAATNNLARIRELASDRELLLALAAMGLTVAEAARIQPSYEIQCSDAANCFCSNGAASAKGAILGKVTSATSGTVAVEVLQTWGAAGTSPGATIEVKEAYVSVGDQVLIAVQLNTGAFVLKDVVYNDTVACHRWSSINARLAGEAMVSPECAKVIARGDARYDCNRDNYESSCAYGHAGGGASLLLGAIALLLVGRSARRYLAE
jgi:hypothetical protein